MIHKLCLFDVDGTLLKTGRAGKDSMVQAFEEIYGVANGFQNIPMMGKTDPGILYEALRHYKIKRDEERAKAFQSRYYQLIEKKIKEDREGKGLCPGVLSLLSELKRHDHVTLGLLTGNWRYSAYVKLRYFGIDDFFEFGAFGGDSPDRNRLLPFALQRAQVKTGEAFLPRHVFVIGDTPRDIECAEVNGAVSVAVASGFCPYDILEKAGPDYLFHDLSETDALISVLV